LAGIDPAAPLCPRRPPRPARAPAHRDEVYASLSSENHLYGYRYVCQL